MRKSFKNKQHLGQLRATEGEIHGFWPYFSKNNVFDSYAKDVYVFLEKILLTAT